MQKVISILLAFLLLTSSVGFAMNTHFCGGLAVEQSLSFHFEDLDCGMDMEFDCESEPAKEAVKAKACCENQHEFHQLDEDLIKQAVNASKDVKQTIAAVQTVVFETSTSSTLKVRATNNHSPPLQKVDIRLLFQTFLL
jgi:hypothetical protein